MKTLILDGSETGDHFTGMINSELTRILKDKECAVENILFHEHKIHGCIGDLECFFKSPGKCLINDIVQKIPQKYIQADLVFLLTPMTFGGYSSLFARAFDRILIQLVSHLFIKSDRELLRKRRYETTYPSLIFIGIEETDDMESRDVFEFLTRRNAFRLFAPVKTCLYFSRNKKYQRNEIIKIIHKTLSEIRGNNAN